MSRPYTLQVRVSKEEKETIEKKVNELGFHSVSEYLRFLGKNAKKVNVEY